MMKKLLIASMVAVGLAGCGAMMGGGGAPQRSVGQAVDDVTIGTKLKAALAADPQLSERPAFVHPPPAVTGPRRLRA